MPPQTVDRRIKARHKRKPVVIQPVQLAALPSVPHTTPLKPAAPKKPIFNPSPAALAFNPLDQVGPSVGNALKQIIPGGGLPGIPGLPGQDSGIPGIADQLGVPAISNPLGSVSDAIGWLIHPQRLIKIVGGGILILMGLHQLTKAITGATPGKHAHKLGESLMTAATLIPK